MIRLISIFFFLLTLSNFGKEDIVDKLTKLANLEYGTNLTPEEYAEYWESAKFTYNQPGQCGDLQGSCPPTSWVMLQEVQIY